MRTRREAFVILFKAVVVLLPWYIAYVVVCPFLFAFMVVLICAQIITGRNIASLSSFYMMLKIVSLPMEHEELTADFFADRKKQKALIRECDELLDKHRDEK